MTSGEAQPVSVAPGFTALTVIGLQKEVRAHGGEPVSDSETNSFAPADSRNEGDTSCERPFHEGTRNH